MQLIPPSYKTGFVQVDVLDDERNRTIASFYAAPDNVALAYGNAQFFMNSTCEFNGFSAIRRKLEVEKNKVEKLCGVITSLVNVDHVITLEEAGQIVNRVNEIKSR